ncbi:hypothetical protein IV203_016261 [Nitzschia inconspicua]|uniref:Uncharacterized protein n=1 Tax=Nitzschia inconspicua TaxID=303405 RepID=A0A9K3KQA5_9STRA|nr:hypothetical protein IV203_017475 [Nitzschia inconspicua]KAG7347556.1 hypothetical protein IV203_016261 [Nitzschia inconspicua]
MFTVNVVSIRKEDQNNSKGSTPYFAPWVVSADYGMHTEWHVFFTWSNFSYTIQYKIYQSHSFHISNRTLCQEPCFLKCFFSIHLRNEFSIRYKKPFIQRQR